jgi:nitrogen fixation-related uncharacterized protein
MTPVYVLIWGSWLLFAVSAIWALVWAIDRRQFDRPEESARSIFDDDELGRMTDHFPGEGPGDRECAR